MQVDLHCHSVHSDGTMTPQELLSSAKEKGLKYFAITDHDDIEGSKELVSLNHDGITIYSGVELNAKVSKGQMHILGYNFDLYDKTLNEKLIELKRNSIATIKLYIAQLENDFGIFLPEEDITALLSKEGNIGRPQLAIIMMKYGYVKDVNEAFKKYLKDDKVRHLKKSISKEECIKMINNAGGVASLAHPWSLKLTNEELYEEIRYLVSIGLKGIEVYHSKSAEEQRAYYHYLAEEFGLLETGGTDFHGLEVKPDIELGSGINNNVNIDENTLSLTKRIKSRYK